jgi:beta-lactamase regulating signal transducer with metallopeptidase domain
MGLGTSLFLIAVGAILKFAISTTAHGVNINTIGVILMIVGAVGLVISLFYMTMWADRRRQVAAPADRAVVREPVARDPDVY